MRDEDIESTVAETCDVGVVRRLAGPPVDSVCAVTPVDGERPTEKAEGPAPERDACSTRDVGHMVGQGIWFAMIAVLGEREVVIVVAVDEPELDTVDSARSVDSGEEAWAAWKIGAIATKFFRCRRRPAAGVCSRSSRSTRRRGGRPGRAPRPPARLPVIGAWRRGLGDSPSPER